MGKKMYVTKITRSKSMHTQTDGANITDHRDELYVFLFIFTLYYNMLWFSSWAVCQFYNLVRHEIIHMLSLFISRRACETDTRGAGAAHNMRMCASRMCASHHSDAVNLMVVKVMFHSWAL